MFPAYAGMNRRPVEAVISGEGVPRIRGDEPFNHSLAEIVVQCSPHTRG